MVVFFCRMRAKAAGLDVDACCHTFRATGITAYMENGGLLENAQAMADVTGVTFVIVPTALVTVRYHPVETFDLFSQKLCKAPAQALFPDAVVLGLINTGLNRSARAVSKASESLDRIASAVFRAKGDQSKRNQIYSDTLDALGREDEKVSNLRESMVSVERLLLFLMSEGRPENVPKSMREATKAALRDLQTMEQDASFKAQKVQFLLDSTLGRINLVQNDIIKLFSVIAVVFMPPTPGGWSPGLKIWKYSKWYSRYT